MKTKPVAWMNCNTGSELSMDWLPAVLFDRLIIDNKHDWIPLYTHPAKELTQGEIHAVWASGQYYTLDKEGNVDEIRFEDFARAILRKAQKK